MDIFVEGVHGCVGGPGCAEVVHVALDCQQIHQRPEMLVRHMLKVESNVGSGCDGELGSDASPVLGKRGTKEANRPTHLVGLLCPLTSRCRAARGAELQERGRDAIVNHSLNALGLVHGNEVDESGNGPRTFGKNASCKLHSSKKELAAWLQ